MDFALLVVTLSALVMVASTPTPRDVVEQTAVTDLTAGYQDNEEGDTEDGATPGTEVVGTTETFEVTQDKTFTYELELWSGDVTPEPGLDPALDGAEGNRYVLVQFVDDDLGDHVDDLDALDLEITDHVDPTAVFARVPGSQLQTLADHETVRAVMEIQPEWRRSPGVDRAVEAGAIGPETRVPMLVDFFEAIDPSDYDGFERWTEDAPIYAANLTTLDVEDLQSDPLVRWITPRGVATSQVPEGHKLVGTAEGPQPGPVDYSTTSKAISPTTATGKGVVVGVVDTGIEHSHPHFANTKIIDGRDFIGVDNNPEAVGDHHGTHVAGTIAGRTRPRTGPDVGDPHTVHFDGIAPDADLAIVRAVQDDGSKQVPLAPTTTWFRNLHLVTLGKVKIISNSWATESFNAGDYGVVSKRLDGWAWRNSDTLITFANGNYPDVKRYPMTAMAKNVLSVGAISDGTWEAGESSSGEISHNQVTDLGEVKLTQEVSKLNNLSEPQEFFLGTTLRKKPELVAPGEGTLAPSLDGDYAVISGTSMATPHVSAVAARLAEQRPGITANELRALLVETRAPVRNSGGYQTGFGAVNAHNALGTNLYEEDQKLWHVGDGIVQRQVKTRSFNVPPGTEQVSATLSWIDPPKSSLAKNPLRNNLYLYLGPASDLPQDRKGWKNLHTYVDKGEANVKRLSHSNPQPGNWVVAVYGWQVNLLKGRQPYDVAYRLETEPAEIRWDAQDIEVPVGESENSTVTIRGTGAPVAGIHAWIGNRDSNDLRFCDEKGDQTTDTPAYVVGTLSEGREATFDVCFTGETPGRYNATLNIRTTDPLLRFINISVWIKENQPPEEPGSVWSPTHSVSTWSNETEIRFQWNAALDTGGSGISHYLVALDQQPTNNDPKQLKVKNLLRYPRSGGATRSSTGEYYFHIRAVDNAGNEGPVATVGPYKIDLDRPVIEDLKLFQGQYSEGPRRFTYEPAVNINRTKILTGWKGSDKGSGFSLYDVSLCHPWEDPCSSEYTSSPGKEYSGLVEGIYVLRVEAEDEAGNMGWATLRIRNDMTDPTAQVRLVGEAQADDVATLNASNSQDLIGTAPGAGGTGQVQGRIIEYRWDLGDGTTTKTTQPEVEHTYANEGTYTVTVETVDWAGNTDTATLSVQVAPASPASGVVGVLAALGGALWIRSRREND